MLLLIPSRLFMFLVFCPILSNNNKVALTHDIWFIIPETECINIFIRQTQFMPLFCVQSSFYQSILFTFRSCAFCSLLRIPCHLATFGWVINLHPYGDINYVLRGSAICMHKMIFLLAKLAPPYLVCDLAIFWFFSSLLILKIKAVIYTYLWIPCTLCLIVSEIDDLS